MLSTMMNTGMSRTVPKAKRRVMIVSASDKIFDFAADLLPPGEFVFEEPARSAGEAKRTLIQARVDILIINTPLPDDFGTELATELSDSTMGILLLVKNDLVDSTAYKVEDFGVLTLAKPCGKQSFYQAVKLLSATSAKLERLDEKNRTLEEKMADIRMVNRAKWLLIDNLGMNEKDAHHYIEKRAMDSRQTRREVAEGIIRTYDK
ncbi:MAG: ANTAR domain-containing protein [Candidatus Flemingibacterium sp.]|nr:ANTAR domain-containing protein [Candidatus Flemingibacterium sp.]